jgi:hypothetical protein
LYREDLEEIVRIFRIAAPDSTVSIEDDETQYPSFAEVLVQKGPMVFSLRLINPTVGIKLQLQRSPTATKTTTLATTKISDEADLTFYRAKEYLEVRRRPSEYVLGTVLPALCLSLIPLICYLIYPHLWEQPPMQPRVALLPVTLAFAISGFVIGILSAKSPYCRVTLRTEKEDARFFKRNKDRFLMSLLFFVLGILVTLITMLFKK